MRLKEQSPYTNISLPRQWKPVVKSAVLDVISLAHLVICSARGSAANGRNARVAYHAQIDRLHAEIAQLKEEIRIKDARMGRIDAQRRPHYPPAERMAILELRAARGWSLKRTARAFLVAPGTIAAWMKRLDEHGPEALLQLREPVNKFPEFVRYLVQRLKVLCPRLGKVKIAQILCRAGLHLAPTTVGRMLKQRPASPSAVTTVEIPPCREKPKRVVTAKRPNHVWHVDLTVVPTSCGFWTAWLPFALPQCWPFCWWVAVVVDHFSRRVIGFAVFKSAPTSVALRSFLGRTIAACGVAPKHLVCDKGAQFWCLGFKTWCRRKRIKPRFGAVRKQGSIAVIERFFRTLKDEATRRIVVSQRRRGFQAQLTSFILWYNAHRPHAALSGRTPDEVYCRRHPANQKPRIEPRSRWPRGSPCAKPQTLVAGHPGDRCELHVTYVDAHKLLPVVSVRRAA